MRHSEGTFSGSGGLQLYYQSWRPDGTPRGVLAIVHGIGEHSGRYVNVVNHLVANNFAVYSFDHRGHGRSPGQRAYISQWADFREDVRAFLRLVSGREPDRPLFLMGHSLGGLIVLEYVLHHPDGLKGVIASAPALGGLGVPPLLLSLSRVLARLWPTFSLNTGLNVSGISRDPMVVKAYQEDPLVHGKGTARLGAEVPAAIAWTQAHAADLKLPLLMLHGSADLIVGPASSQLFFENVTYPDKKRIVYEGGYHESHNDTHYNEVTADLSQWLEEHS
jgi:alpha-beta hydrolase superfamily lysophospholipase